jgi:hypothetical protein
MIVGNVDKRSDMADMDAFLAGAVRRQGAVDAISKAINTRLGAKLGSDEWRTANATVQAWEKRNEWHPAEYQVHLTVETCQCGASGKSFDGFFSVLRHKTKSTVEYKRLTVAEVSGIAVSGMERVVARVDVPVCVYCYETKGKQHEEESGRAGPAGLENAGDVEGEDGHVFVV